MNLAKAALTLAAVLMCAACATSSYQGARPAKPGTQLVGTRVVIYSFLEAKNDFFGETMVQQLHNQLLERLAQRDVAARLVVYKSPEGMQPALQKHFSATSETVVVSLKDYLKSQRPDETRHADTYRLLVMPWLMTNQQSTAYSRIDWTLTDIATEQPVWFVNQNTSRTIMLNRDEAPKTLASHYVDGAIKQMTESGLFGAPSSTK